VFRGICQVLDAVHRLADVVEFRFGNSGDTILITLIVPAP
jgi:hypothetical protein